MNPYRAAAIQHWRDQHATIAVRIRAIYIERIFFAPNTTPDLALINCRETVFMGNSATNDYEFNRHCFFHTNLRERNFDEAEKCLLFYIPELSTSEEVCYVSQRNYVLIRGVEPIVDISLCCIGCLREKRIDKVWIV